MPETITAIDPLPSDPNVLRVRVDGRIVARLGRADVEALELAEGKRWTDRLAARVQQAIELAKARKAALAMLGRRALSRGELSERLKGKGHHAAIVDDVANELESDGWIDDHAYAQAIAHEVMRRKPASPELLMQKIRARLVDAGIAQQVAQELMGAVNSADEATAFARKKFKSMSSLPASTAARRISGALARRGFDEDTIQTVLQRLGVLEED